MPRPRTAFAATPRVFAQLALIGCGMMGCSFALAARRAGLVRRVVGHSKSAATVARAYRLGFIDQRADSIASALSGADMVLVCVPVAAMAEVFAALHADWPAEALVMDVGSTKSSVIEVARKALGTLPANFVPCHPIAGKETAGAEAADVDLYVGKPLVVTPHVGNSEVWIQQACAVWTALHMRVQLMDAHEHDRTCAAVSHLPHLLAFAYMDGLLQQPQALQMLAVAGSGFRDFSRIAASNPEMWRDVFAANRRETLLQVEYFRAALERFEQAIRTGDLAALQNSIAQVSHARAAWRETSEVDLEELH